VEARQRAADRLVQWCATAADVALFSEGLFERLATVVPYDGGFLAAVDPATLLYTRAFRRDMPTESSAAFLRSELGPDDVNQLRQLVRRPGHLGWLDAATRGDRMTAQRYRDAMQPYGLGDELRVALFADGTCWGLLCLHRAAGRTGFDAREAAVLAGIAPHVGGALRRALVTEQAVGSDAQDGPGVILLEPDGSLGSATAAGMRWLAELADLDRPRSQELPTVVRSVVERLRTAAGSEPSEPDERSPYAAPGAARARVRTPSGQWLTVHASVLDEGPGRVAVVVEPTTPALLAPLIIAAYGLTVRESEVTQGLLVGLARKEIAADLRISLHTVNDHVKAVFDKTGVSSAGQLRAQVFAGSRM
jgi:DNA-binding CsgD family transcriptional regulator/GAF domain-containing protein